MSLWAAIAGASNEYLRQSQVEDEEKRWMKKQELLAKIQEEQQFKRDQRQAEREDRQNQIRAESEKLARMREDEQRAEARARQDKKDAADENYRKQSLALRGQEMAESRASREDYRKSQAEERDRLAAERAAQTFMSGLMVEDEKTGKLSPRPGVDPVSVRNAMSYYEELISQGKYREAMKALRGVQQAMVLGDPIPSNVAVSERY